MKKLIAAVLALCIVGGAIPTVQKNSNDIFITANAEDDPSTKEVKEGPLTYRLFLNDGCAEVIGCDTDFEGDLVIPDKIEGYDVRKIDELALNGCDGIKNLSIPASVSEIGLMAFSFDEHAKTQISFESITVDENNELYSSENGVLFNKDKTELLRYPVFYSDKEEYKSVMEYEVPDTVKKIGPYAFCDTYVEKVKLPDTLEEISVGAFWDSRIEEINLPASIATIPASAFRGTSLKTFDVPDTVTKIDDSAFRKCRSLEKVIIPDTVEEIGEYAFSDCDRLSEVKLPKQLGRIEEGTFSGCKNLKQITIPNYVSNIGPVAFAETGLETVTLPGSVEHLGDSTYSAVFADCPNLKAVTVINPNVVLGQHDIYNTHNERYDGRYSGVIFGRSGSATQQTAEEAGITFIPMNVPDGSVRVTLIDYYTGELIPDSYIKEHNYTFGTDIGYKKDDVPGGWILTGPFYNVPSNSYVFEDALPEHYAKADRFAITTKDDVVINHYTNETFDCDFPDSMDIVIRAVPVAGGYLQPGQVEVKLLDYDTEKSLELTDKFDYRLPVEIRTVDPDTGEYGDYVDQAGPQIISNHFICKEFDISSGCELTAVNIDNDALPAGYTCLTNAGDVMKNSNGSYTITLKLRHTKTTLMGDANLDDQVNIADAVLVMQVATNPDKYGPDNRKTGISQQGYINADVDGKKGLSNHDALLIQQFKLGLIDKF